MDAVANSSIIWFAIKYFKRNYLPDNFASLKEYKKFKLLPIQLSDASVVEQLSLCENLSEIDLADNSHNDLLNNLPNITTLITRDLDVSHFTVLEHIKTLILKIQLDIFIDATSVIYLLKKNRNIVTLELQFEYYWSILPKTTSFNNIQKLKKFWIGTRKNLVNFKITFLDKF